MKKISDKYIFLILFVLLVVFNLLLKFDYVNTTYIICFYILTSVFVIYDSIVFYFATKNIKKSSKVMKAILLTVHLIITLLILCNINNEITLLAIMQAVSVAIIIKIQK